MESVILASGSPRRQELLKQMGLEFEVIPAEIDEVFLPSVSPVEMVQRLACQKAAFVAEQKQKGVVIAADTVVVLDGRVMGKPGTEDEARDMLSSLSARVHHVITGLCVMRAETGQTECTAQETAVWFRPLTPSEITTYIASGEPFDKAGSYGIQGLGALLVEKIQGCYFNVVGLPVSTLYLMLRKQGIDILGR